MSLEGKDIVNAAKKRPIVFICAALIFILLGLMYWRSGEIPELQGQVDDRTSVLRKSKINVTYSVQLDAQLKALTDINQKIKASGLRAENLAQNQQVFYRMEAETGVKLIDIQQRATDSNLAKGAVATVYLPIVFSITIEGDYRELLTFLKKLEAGPTITRVSGATLMMSANNALSLSLTVEMLGLRQ